MKLEIMDGGAEEATEEYECIDMRGVFKAYAVFFSGYLY